MTDAYQLRPWTDVVAPHRDVASGDFDMGTFAANLAAIAYRTEDSRAVYTDAAAFFAATYLTPAMLALLDDVFGVLAGQPGDRAVQLRTPFGGGKTHTLLALYHLATARDRAVAAAEGALDELPDPGPVRLAVLSGEHLDPARGREVEGRTIHTLWGELAYQLGGWEAYDALLVNGEESTPPSGKDLVPLLSEAPALVLLDEVLVYIVKGKALRQGDTTAGQLALIFVQNLSEAVNQVRQAAMVYSLQASVGEAVQEETVLTALEHITARVDVRREPVSGDEVLRVVQRRLFDGIGDTAIVARVAEEYGKLLRADLLSQAETEDARREAAGAAERLEERIAECYPFHPELIDLMYQRWGSLPSYQRTRGALQFLATVVHALWSQQSSRAPQALISPGDVDLGDEHVRTSFFEQVGEATQYAAVVEADFLGANAGTTKVDERIGRESPALRSLQVGARVATTILLLSFGAREGEERGALEREIVQASLVPGLDGNVIRAALRDMRRETLLYLHHTGRRYRFETRPNLNLLIANEEQKLTSEEVLAVVRARLERAIGAGGQQISIWPDDSAKIADGVPAFVTAYLPPDTDTSPEELARLVSHCGEAPRKHKNGMALVIAGPPIADAARRAGRTLNAVSALLGQTARHQFSPEQKEELKERATEAERALATSVGQMYERVLLPVGNDGPGGVRFESVDLGTVLSAGRSIHERVRDALNLHVFDTLKPKRLLALTKLAERGTVRCDVLIESFFSYYEFTKLWGVGPLHEAIATGVAAGDFAYAIGVSDEDGTLSVADRSLVHLAGRTLDPAEIDLGPGAVLLTESVARTLIGEPPAGAGDSDVGDGMPSGPSSIPQPDGESTGSGRGGEKRAGYRRVTLNIAATEGDLHTVQRALSGLRDVTLPGTMQIQVRVLAERAEGEIDEVTFRNRVREPLEEDSDVSHQEEWG
jgi:hypothetical protein